MTPWLNQFMHDAAGGILGGMGGTVFGPAGVVVGYICGAYTTSCP
jgi:hypothetical protein